MNKPMWMVRSATGGRLADECREKNVVAIGWEDLGDLKPYKDKQALLKALPSHWDDWTEGKYMSSASQLIRFRDEISKGDRVVTYDSSTRIYHVGTITGEYEYRPELITSYPNIRPVKWEGQVERDRLSVSTKNSLGSTLTLFLLPEEAAQEVESVLKGQKPAPSAAQSEETNEEGLLESYVSEAFEITKDRVNRLDWDQMQELVAGLLRAMGYKTKVSPAGSDRGMDIMASRDGFGFEPPRIIVQVKHRSGQIGAPEIRSFLGGRHKDDKGLYVSTGGFSKEARYEADRASIPVMLMDIDGLVQAILQNYENMDMDARNLLPLKKIYWPV